MNWGIPLILVLGVIMSGKFEWSDCDFVGKSSQGLGVHRSKKHNCLESTYMDVQSVSVVREYPERRSFYCCLCNSSLLNFPHFTRHFKNLHSGIEVLSSAKCSVCGKEFLVAKVLEFILKDPNAARVKLYRMLRNQ